MTDQGKTEPRADFWPRILCLHHFENGKCVRCLLPQSEQCSCGHLSNDHSRAGCTFLIGMRYHADGTIAPMDPRKAHNCPCTGFEPRVVPVGFIAL